MPNRVVSESASGVPIEDSASNADRNGRKLVSQSSDGGIFDDPLNVRILKLRSINGLSYSDIAQLTGISENAAKVRFHRIKQKSANPEFL